MPTKATAARVVRRSAAPVAAAGVLAAGVAALFGRVPLSFDSYFALIWGRDLAHGRSPDLELGVAPAPHPLFNALSGLLAPLGNGAEAGLWVAVLLSFGAACVAVYRIAATLGGPGAGLLAAGLLATRPPLLEVTVRASADVPALALVLWAIALELERPRRGAAVLGLLALAGLLRPEAWLMAAAYWLWTARGSSARTRVRLGLLTAIGPVLWLAHDLALTGDPLWSRNHSVDKVGTAYKTGLDGLAEVPRHVGSILGVSGCIAAVAGLAFAGVRLRARPSAPGAAWQRMPILLAVLVLSGVAAVALAVGGQPIVQRYFLLPAALLLALGAAAAASLIAMREPGQAARRTRRTGIALAVLLVALLPLEAVRVGDLRSKLRGDERLQSELRHLVAHGPARAAIERCRPVYLSAGGMLPTLAFALDLPPARFGAATPKGAFVATLPPAAEEVLPYPLTPPPPPPPGQVEAGRSRSWVVLGGCPEPGRG